MSAMCREGRIIGQRGFDARSWWEGAQLTPGKWVLNGRAWMLVRVSVSSPLGQEAWGFVAGDTRSSSSGGLPDFPRLHVSSLIYIDGARHVTSPKRCPRPREPLNLAPLICFRGSREA